MSHSHHHPIAPQAHHSSGRHRLIHRLLSHLHDSEWWANYWPRIPRRFLFLAFAGLAFVGLAIWLRAIGSDRLAALSLSLGLLLNAPVMAVWLFVRRRWRHRSGVRNHMLDARVWRGDESVLDVGCGSGLMLNGAAKRLRSGKAIGIDIWAMGSGGGNLALLWQNARSEGVADKIEFREADARHMPFDDQIFDVVMCSGALHHICRDRTDFEQVMREFRRVLKPGGQVMIGDVTHMIEASAMYMRAAGIVCDVRPAPRFLGHEMGILIGQRPT